jgi:hypothetical protein
VSAVSIVLAAGLSAVGAIWIESAAVKGSTTQLEDGSSLTLEKVRRGKVNRFVHGSALEKAVRKLLPTNGIHLSDRIQVKYPVVLVFGNAGGISNVLTAEFKLSGKWARDSELVWSRVYREMRVVMILEGQQAACSDLLPFDDYGDGYFGYATFSPPDRNPVNREYRIERRFGSQSPWTTIATLYWRENNARH